ncbi:polysaccharide deacetylase family protein [Grosmannia clavigera kw1407]|uniref:Polysaccharide deacetylase family protein n=1 Tax=Grosmannia clavigera (strain kw1407 / UAMH 11150) TaxID=655863 RepID=F0XD70_GROCL|nr:polysaccharide deacetylase family protein [Grosmannia clavigera kw1407]EFX03490.1 polysaccharide deacetylase family protein [Grosmannia clavigera kw1407]
MAPKRVLCGYGIDVDAVANWHQGSWFMPAHSIESFLAQLTKVRDAGHEIGLHGYTHEYPSDLSEVQQRDVLEKSIKVMTRFCGGKKPVGYTAPAWATSKELIPHLEEYGIIYDHSFMHHDFQMYFCPDSSHDWVETNCAHDASTWMRPMSKVKPSQVVEIPANWHLDDWPPLQPILGKPSHEYIDTEFIFPISIHPQISGKPHVVLLHEQMIKYINSFEGVEWMTMAEMAQEFLQGRITGAAVEGGVDL